MKPLLNETPTWSASTESARLGRRGDSWCAALESFTDVQDLTIADEAQFEGKLAARRFRDDVLVVELAAQPNTLTHRVRPRNRTNEAIFAMVFLAGHGSVTQCGRSVDFRTGDAVFRGANQLTRLRLDAPSRAVGIFIPTNRFCGAPIGDLAEDGYPFAVGAEHPLAATLHSLFATMASRLASLDDASFTFLEKALVDLVGGCAFAVRARDDRVPRSGTAADRWKAVTGAIEARLGDPELRVADVARIVGCSVRWLQKIFATQGTHFERYLLQRRLEHARLALVADAGRSITDIGLDCGFNDLGHFSRSFKDRFGASPRAYRNRT